MARAISYRLLASGQIQQQFPGERRETTIDPAEQLQPFTHATGKDVRAVQIPRPFTVGGETCKDGYLVLDDRGLKAVSAETFRRDYAPALTLEAVRKLSGMDVAA